MSDQRELPFGDARNIKTNTYIENMTGGTVNVFPIKKPVGRPCKEPDQTCENITFRTDPQKRAEFQRAASHENSNMTKFLETCGEFGVVYSFGEMKWMLEHEDLMRKFFNYASKIAPLLNDLP